VLTVNEYDGPSVVAGFSPGADTPGLGPPPPPPARITMSAEKTSLVWAAHTALHGTVSQWTHGSRVEVHASTFPFTSERVIATYTDRADFFVPISPVRNTVYWATYGDLKTARVPVFMDLWQKGLMTGHGSHTHLAVSFKGPAGAPLARRRVFTYVYRAAERRAVRLGSMRLGRVRRRGGSDFAKARRRVTAPRRRRGDYLFFCLEEKHDDGFGKPDPADAECGHRILH
jgi:hypothetical protein